MIIENVGCQFKTSSFKFHTLVQISSRPVYEHEFGDFSKIDEQLLMFISLLLLFIRNMLKFLSKSIFTYFSFHKMENDKEMKVKKNIVH